MRITPLDIHSQLFSKRFRGLDPEEVASFLRVVADDYESLLRENERQADELQTLERRVDDLSSNEKLLRETLLTAQAVGEELRRGAVQEADVLIGQAEVQAEKVIDAAHRRAAQLAEEVREMRGLRTRLASSLRTSLETHLTLIDAFAEADEDDPVASGRLAYLAPSARAADKPHSGQAQGPAARTAATAAES